MSWRQLAIPLSVGGSLLACQADTPQPEPARAVARVVPIPGVSARQPSRQFFLGYEGHGCVVYALHGGQRSRGAQTRCPRGLHPGERIRLAGSTCARESPVAKRNLPMRCPSPLIDAEVDARRDAGHAKLQ